MSETNGRGTAVDSNAQALMSVKNLTKVFKTTSKRRGNKETKAVDNFSLDIAHNEFVCFIGPSGCGKTTFLRLIAGLIEPTHGEITIAGKTVHGPGPDRGMVFQMIGLMPWLTVEKNIEFALELRNVPKEERKTRAVEAVKMVGLSDFIDYYPHEISGGMQQRVGIARALAVEPEILLMDEPFGALDAITRGQLQDDLLLLWEKHKKTVLFVTHSIDEAVLLSDRIIILTKGRFLQAIKNPLPRPRKRNELIGDLKMLEVKRDLTKLIDKASREVELDG